MISRIVPRVRCVVLVPTRDLVLQVKDVFRHLIRGTDLKVATIFGEKSFKEEQLTLVGDVTNTTDNDSESESERESKVDIVIATPGRLVDHLNGTLGFTLQHLRYLVIDEADRLLTQSYQNWLPQVLNALQKPKERDLRLLSTVDDDMNEQSVDKNNIDNKNNRGDNEQSYPLPTAATSRSECLRYYPTLQKLLFSATLSHNPKKIASLQLVNPRFFAFTSQFVYKIPETLKQHLVVCKTDVKPLALVYLFQKLKASQILCFTSSVETTHRLHLLMKTLISEEILPSKFKFVEYSSQLSQKEKVKIVKHFKEGLINLIICSDVMSRGLDIEDVDVVINYEIPKHIKTYVHRVGRTARAGRSGQCFTFLRPEEVKPFKLMLKKVENSKQKEFKLDYEFINSLMPRYEEALKQLKIELEREEGAIQQISVDILKANINVMTSNPNDRQYLMEALQNQAFVNFFGQKPKSDKK